MLSIEYKKAITEVLVILRYTSHEDVKKIPKSFMRFLNENREKNYQPLIDANKSIKELNLSSKTEAILGLIYLKFWASNEEKEKFNIKIQEVENILTDTFQKVGNEEIFKRTNSDVVKQNINVNLPESIEKENIFNKIINKIKYLFRRK